MTVRPFNDTEEAYTAAVSVLNAAYPDQETTVEEFREQDRRRDSRCRRERWLAFLQDKPVGYAAYDQNSFGYDPRRFHLTLAVVPGARRQGVGTALYQSLEEALLRHNPMTLRVSLREEWTDSLRFAQARRFAETERQWESRLDISAFDMAKFAHRYHLPEEHGIEIRTMRELDGSDPDFIPKAYELAQATVSDLPTEEPVTLPPIELFETLVLRASEVIPEAMFVAIDTASGRYVGLSNLDRRQADRDLETGFTGVHTAFRGKGIAWALKLRAVEYAQSVGAPFIRTVNSTVNRPMLAINEALGFTKQPVKIFMVKNFDQVAAGNH